MINNDQGDGQTKLPRVAVVTVTFNSSGVIDDFLHSISRQIGVSVKLFAVDNASKDDTVETLRNVSEDFDLEIFSNAENLGVAEGNNIGISAALAQNYDWILLLNNDTIFGESFVREMVTTATVREFKILSPLIEATEPKNTTWYSSGSLNRLRGFRAGHGQMGHPIDSARKGIYRTEYASTCALLVHSEVFSKVGLMDEQYFVYFDDVDFCIRARAAGFQYWVNSETVMTHKASSLTGGSLSEFTIYWVSRNWVLICRKHQSAPLRAMSYCYMQFSMLVKMLMRRETPKHYAARQRAFLAGLRLPLAR
jgi:GT2 family glycosyltransferase